MNTAPISGFGRSESSLAMQGSAKRSSTSNVTTQKAAESTPVASDASEKVLLSSLASETSAETSATAASEGASLDDTLIQEALAERVQTLNETMRQQSTQLEFSIDGDLGNVVVKVLNKETGEVIRQIPPDEVLNLTKSFNDLRGLMLSGTL